MKVEFIPIITIIIAAALLIPSAHAAAPNCPPDIAIKWYALVNYLAYASGQNATQLIAEAQATGNLSVTISGVKLTVPYCSLNATAASGNKVVFAPAVGTGELKKLGLNITQAKAVFQKLKDARDQAMKNLDRYLRPLEGLGLDNATKAVAADRGYREAAEANMKVAALLKEIAALLDKVGANKTAAERLAIAARMHEEVAQALSYLGENGGLAGIREKAAANLTSALNDTVGIGIAISNVERALAYLNATLRILEEANASKTAILKVQEAITYHEKALEVLRALNAVGGAAGVEQNVYEAIMGMRGLDPNVVALCIDLNLTNILASLKLGVNATALQLKYGTICELVKLLDWQYYANKTRRGVMMPMDKINSMLRELRTFINLYGGLSIFRNIYSIKMLNNYIAELENGLSGSLQITGSQTATNKTTKTPGGGSP